MPPTTTTPSGNILAESVPTGGGGQAWPFEHRAFGELYDRDLGMVFLRKRWMDPSDGRFVSRDPFGGRLVEPSSLHRYAYVSSNPTNMIDPSGRIGVDIHVGALTLKVGLIGILKGTKSVGVPVGGISMAEYVDIVEMQALAPIETASDCGDNDPLSNELIVFYEFLTESGASATFEGWIGEIVEAASANINMTSGYDSEPKMEFSGDLLPDIISDCALEGRKSLDGRRRFLVTYQVWMFSEDEAGIDNQDPDGYFRTVIVSLENEMRMHFLGSAEPWAADPMSYVPSDYFD